MATSSGMIDLADVRPDDVNLEEIAVALGRLCRYTGHGRMFYSVAEHSVLVAQIVEEYTAESTRRSILAALLHDANEAYVGDISRPMKQLLSTDPAANNNVGLDALTLQIDRAIMLRLGLDVCPRDIPCVVKADVVASLLEMRAMFGLTWDRREGEVRELADRCADLVDAVVGWMPDVATNRWLRAIARML